MQFWNLFKTFHYLLRENSSIPDSVSLQCSFIHRITIARYWVSDIDALRWFLFSKQNYTRDRLPPTWGALNFVARMWHLSELQPRDSKSSCGWVLSEEKLSAHVTDNLPAPLATIEMSVYKCDKSKCVRGNCSCYRNRI